MAKVRRLICPECGNTEDFVVDSERKCVAATLSFTEDEAELDDDFAQDIDIYPAHCAKCGADLPQEDSSRFFMQEKKEVVCNHCKHKFLCFTSRDKCIGFQFPQEKEEVELA